MIPAPHFRQGVAARAPVQDTEAFLSLSQVTQIAGIGRVGVDQLFEKSQRLALSFLGRTVAACGKV